MPESVRRNADQYDVTRIELACACAAFDVEVSTLLCYQPCVVRRGVNVGRLPDTCAVVVAFTCGGVNVTCDVVVDGNGVVAVYNETTIT